MSEVSKILDYSGFRTLATWFTTVINNLWKNEGKQISNEVKQSAFGFTDSIFVGMQDTVETLCAPLDSNQLPTYSFLEDKEYTLGQIVTINGTDYVVPSAITDTDGNKHAVFPMWKWVVSGSTTVDGVEHDTGDFGWVVDSIIYHHNACYLGGYEDGKEWVTIGDAADITITAVGQVTLTTEAAPAVGQWVRLTVTKTLTVEGETVEQNRFAYGYVSAVSGTSVTITTVEQDLDTAADAVTIVEFYKEAAQ